MHSGGRKNYKYWDEITDKCIPIYNIHIKKIYFFTTRARINRLNNLRKKHTLAFYCLYRRLTVRVMRICLYCLIIPLKSRIPILDLTWNHKIIIHWYIKITVWNDNIYNFFFQNYNYCKIHNMLGKSIYKFFISI